MTRAGCLGALVIIACTGCGGSAAPPAASPIEEAASTEAAPTPPDDDRKSKDSGDAQKTEGSASTATSADELGSMLQRVIEDEELDKHLNLTLPGRFPLKISGADLPSGLSLTKGNQPVSVVGPPSSKKDAVLVVTTVEVNGPDATIAYRYDVEGIRGTARLKKGERGWELKNSRIVEH